jgi:putative membrane-bound dehydrogenase-like protein
MRPLLVASLLGLGVVLPALLGLAQDQPLPPREAPLRMTLPNGFRATLFAGEPDVVQPIACALDDRGRLWVAECYSYPKWLREKEGKDRILIFEDRDGDGRFDMRKVFHDQVANLTGLQVGFGGVWVCATPYLLFLPDRNGDDVPDGPPEVVLDGWDLQGKHNVFNGLTWGPDGWLYGCNGILSNSKVGKPGTPDDRRVRFNCGVWRYHPTGQQFEVVAWGTTNPWGLDFDDHGQMFITNCVIHHLWHVVPGAHFQRMFGQDLNPNCYGLLHSGADHIHWAGGPWQSSRGGQGSHSAPGGGHAHSGAMVYLGDNWPDRYRNGIFLCNIHGNRVNHDLLERQGSTYAARHGQDFLLANDPWFRGLWLLYGPDGGVFVSDWCDTGECHDYDDVHRTSGRIYKITYGHVAPAAVDLARRSDAELVKRQLHRNDWHVRHARRLLQERAAAGKLAPETHDGLRKILSDHADVTRKLRALWALHVTGGLDEPLLLALLDSPHEHLRGWAVQLGLEGRAPSVALRRKLAALAVKDPSPLVRLYLASGLQRLALDQRWPIALGLLHHGQDAQDAYLPLMIWYGIEPLVPADRDRSVTLLARAQIPLVREYLARRLTSLADPGAVDRPLPGLPPLLRLLGLADDPVLHRDILRGMHEALSGLRQMAMPDGWPAVYPVLAESPYPEVRERALALAVLFDDQRALASLRKTVTDPKAAPAARQGALQMLVYKRNADLVPLLQSLLTDRDLCGAALRGLAAFADAATPRMILHHYASFTDEEKSDAIHTLASRPAYALALLEAVERGQVPRRDLSAVSVRQMMGLKHQPVTDKLTHVWGVVRPASHAKAALLARYKKLLTPEYLASADRSGGRLVYARACAACHRLFDEGTAIGPELTGAQRTDLAYILENLLDPSAVVAREYQVTVVTTKGGRVLSGIIKQENDRAVTVQTQNESVTVPRDEIESRTASSVSMMPEGLLDQLTREEVRDLVAYLAGPGQVPLPTAGPLPK